VENMDLDEMDNVITGDSATDKEQAITGDPPISEEHTNTADPPADGVIQPCNKAVGESHIPRLHSKRYMIEQCTCIRNPW